MQRMQQKSDHKQHVSCGAHFQSVARLQAPSMLGRPDHLVPRTCRYKWDSKPAGKKPENGLLNMRASLNAYANLRPCLVLPQLAAASTLKEDVISGVDIMIVRELVGGIYFGQPRVRLLLVCTLATVVMSRRSWSSLFIVQTTALCKFTPTMAALSGFRLFRQERQRLAYWCPGMCSPGNGAVRAISRLQCVQARAEWHGVARFGSRSFQHNDTVARQSSAAREVYGGANSLQLILPGPLLNSPVELSCSAQFTSQS
jgi:hypothetical protein